MALSINFEQDDYTDWVSGRHSRRLEWSRLKAEKAHPDTRYLAVPPG